jgi:ubiquitin-conjugating enzyme E2 J1
MTNLDMLPDPVTESHSHETESAVQVMLVNPSLASEAPKTVAFSRQASELSFPEPDVTIHTVHPTAPPTRTQSTASLNSLVRREEPTHIVHLVPSSRATITTSARTQKPPLLLDTAICVLLVLAFALICRRIF